MGDQCDSNSNINFNYNWCEENFTSHLPEESKPVIHNFSENEALPVPRSGMVFSSECEVTLYCTNYAIQEGFRFMTRSSNKEHDGEVKYLVLECTSEGFRRRCKGMRKQNCGAKICVTLCKDGNYRIQTIMLNHNHELLPHQDFKDIDVRAKRMLDQKGIGAPAERTSDRIHKHVKRISNPKGSDIHVKSTLEQNYCGNDLPRERHLIGNNGDGEALHKYLVMMQEKDRNFYHAIDLNDYFQVRNVFWADGRSRATYESFCDVVIVDTTCLSSQYKVPLVTFVGVNHHGQSVLFGCGLLSCQDLDSLIWLFQSWLCCMSGVPPQGIIADHCKAMQKAVEIVFPSTRHRWCLSCIMKKVPRKMHRYAEYNSLRDLLQKVVYDSLTTDEFERNWKKIVDDFCLEDNKWLKELFLGRHQWVPTFVSSDFWAGVSIDLHSESKHSFFDGYVNQQTTLIQFFSSYDNALQDTAEKEFVADVFSSSNTRVCVSKSPLEQQFQSAYTYAKFLEVQDEFVKKADCNVSVIHDNFFICQYNVIEDVLIGDKPKESLVEVTFDRVNSNVKCSCCLFEFKGILCRHSLAILAQERVKEVPLEYILHRWSKNIKRNYVYAKTSYGVEHHKTKMQRLELICSQFNSVADVAAEFEETSSFVKVVLCNLKEKVQAWTSHLRNASQVDAEGVQ